MSTCAGKGYPGCSSCINMEHDPFECEDCDDESNWEGDDFGDNVNDVEDISMSELVDLINGDF